MNLSDQNQVRALKDNGIGSTFSGLSDERSGVPRILLLANQLSHITCYDEDVMIDFF